MNHNRRLYSINLLSIFLVASQSGLAQSASCLAPLVFPGATLYDVIDATKDPTTSLPRPDLPLSNALITFVPRTPEPADGAVPIDMLITMNFDIQPLLNTFQAETTRALTDNGCSHQNVHSFNFTPAEGALVIRFHVKYVKRACWWFFGDQTTDLATIESNAWISLAFAVSPDHHHIALAEQSGGDDNVSQFWRDFLKILANVASFTPGVNAFGVHLDAQMFQALKAERDFLDGSLASAYFEDASFMKKAYIGKTTLGQVIKVELVFAQAAFMQKDGQTLLSIVTSTSHDHPLAESQICDMKAVLEQQRYQTDKLGKSGTSYSISKGDSLWNIAQLFYGSPGYRWIIADANSIPDNRMSGLRPGRSLRLPPVASYLYTHDLHITKPHENLWKIARKNNAESSLELTTANTQLSNPNLIYHGQIIHTTP